MNKELLRKSLNNYKGFLDKEKIISTEELKERKSTVQYYKGFTKDKIKQMDDNDLYEYLSKLWAMLIWGNKHYIVDKIISVNGLENVKEHLINLVWGKDRIEKRWDSFKNEIKHIGPAMISELLCKTFPDKYLLWNRRAFVGLNYLQVNKIPKYDYQLNGNMYKHLCKVGKEIAVEMEKLGIEDTDLFSVDYFIWRELQVEDNLTKISSRKEDEKLKADLKDNEKAKSIHNDIRDKISDIGEWLGFKTFTEKKIAKGAKVDTYWEATIGNMGRIIYVFEVQTKGSIDSLIVNLLKALNNSAVQGVVAVSDKDQIEKIKEHVEQVKALKDILKYWDYEDVLKIHESLEFINSKINELNLVPEGFPEGR